jgi:hypothetical protein
LTIGYPIGAALGGCVRDRRVGENGRGYKALMNGKSLADRRKMSQKLRATIVLLAAPHDAYPAVRPAATRPDDTCIYWNLRSRTAGT